MAISGSALLATYGRICTPLASTRAARRPGQQLARPTCSLPGVLQQGFGHHAAPLRQQQRRSAAGRSRLVVSARLGGRGSPDIVDRVVAAVPYLLPFLDAFSYGRFLFLQYPIIRSAIAPLSPLVSLYATVPFAQLLAFFGVYLGVVNNRNFSTFVRFNAMQAVLLDILLVLPRLLESLASPPSGGWGLQAYITSQNTVWLFIAASVLAGMAGSLLGQAARLPFVADAADQQLMR